MVAPSRKVATSDCLLETWNCTHGPATNCIICPALHSLIKAGDATAISILDYEPGKLKEVMLTVSPWKVAIGENAIADLWLSPCGRRPLDLLIDQVMYYVRPNGRV
ncbi:MAG: hypothetical protein P8M20_10690 [Planctomycetaceae bacterium]|jgi:hypothetical protein|nr:hypothetical protein [Planctomycetaceae bacterium]